MINSNTIDLKNLLQLCGCIAFRAEENAMGALSHTIALTVFVADFSVVLFRSDCRLFSEKNRMKAHINQWLLTMPYPLEHLSGAIRRGHTMDPEGQRPSQWRCLTKLPREMYSQPIVHKALSRGTICKSACILAEITIRKSQAPSG